MAVVEVPLKGSPKTFSTALAGVTYQMRTAYCPAANGEGGWILDIADVNGNPLVCGIPLVTGADLLEQYAYLGFGGKLYVVTDGDILAVPTFTNIGFSSHLLFETT